MILLNLISQKVVDYLLPTQFLNDIPILDISKEDILMLRYFPESGWLPVPMPADFLIKHFPFFSHTEKTLR